MSGLFWITAFILEGMYHLKNKNNKKNFASVCCPMNVSALMKEKKKNSFKPGITVLGFFSSPLEFLLVDH